MKHLVELLVALASGLGVMVLFVLAGGLIGTVGGCVVAMVEGSGGNFDKLVYSYIMQGAGVVAFIGGLIGLAAGIAAFCSVIDDFDNKQR